MKAETNAQRSCGHFTKIYGRTVADTIKKAQSAAKTPCKDCKS